jgi:hypothetical protein
VADGHPCHRRTQSESLQTRPLESLLEQGSLSRAWHPLDQPRSVLTISSDSRYSHMLQYAVMAEIMGRFGHIGSEVTNCSPPDTGNMGESIVLFRGSLFGSWLFLLFYPEVLARYGNSEQQKRWLVPLLNGEIRSAFAMTERFGAFRITDQRVACQFGPICKLHLLMPRTFVPLSGRKGTK